LNSEELWGDEFDIASHLLEAKYFLSQLIQSPLDKSIEDEVDALILMMLQLNAKVEPDSLARAAYFFVKSKHAPMTPDDVRRIRRNSGKENNAWPSLIPIMTRLENQK
jgi:hypothetical protein